MTVLDSGDVAAEKSGALLNVALAEFLLFAKFAETVASNHSGGIIPLRRFEGKEAGIILR